MIDNIMMILDGVQNNMPFKKLINNIEPLGQLPQLAAIEAASSDIAVLYETVLIDTPLAEIFSIYL
jgi:vacuolar-type H+-ATPase subunit C/Vma6